MATKSESPVTHDSGDDASRPIAHKLADSTGTKSSFTGIDNFRQVPGLHLFRFARPDEATDEDCQSLINLNIKTIVDLRDISEISEPNAKINKYYKVMQYNDKGSFREITKATRYIKPCTVNTNFIHYFMPLAHCREFKVALFKRASMGERVKVGFLYLGDRIQNTAKSQSYASNQIVNPMGLIGLYKDLVTYCSKHTAEALKLLCDPNNVPGAMCCSFGKDRTGICVALLMHICGKTKHEICEEYAKSQELIDASPRMVQRKKEEFTDTGLSDPAFAGAEYSTMSELMDFIVDKYGSLDNYLDSMGIDASMRDKLRSNLMIKNE